MRRTISLAVFLVVFVFLAGVFLVTLFSARQNISLCTSVHAVLMARSLVAENLLDADNTSDPQPAVARLAEQLARSAANAETSTLLDLAAELDAAAADADAATASGSNPADSPTHAPWPGGAALGRPLRDTDLITIHPDMATGASTGAITSDIDWKRHAARFRVERDGVLLYQSPDWDRFMLLPAFLPDALHTWLPALQNLFVVESVIAVSHDGVVTEHVTGQAVSSGKLADAVKADTEPRGMHAATVTVQMDAGLIAISLFLLLPAVLLMTFPIMLLTRIMGGLAARRTSRPVSRLVERLDMLAGATPDTAAAMPLTFRRPPAEIAHIADSLRRILDRMRENKADAGTRAVALEAQRQRLEEQNRSLAESRRQIQEAQTRLVQIQNMASIGQLTAAISHEMNTPLGTLASNIQLQEMMLEMLATDPAAQADPQTSAFLADMVRTSRENARHIQGAADMVKSLKNYARLDQSEYQETDINDLIRNVVTLTTNLWRDRIRMHGAYGALPPVKCRPGLLSQLFMHLIRNAIEAMPAGGDVWIRTQPDGEQVVLEVEDNGPGVPEDRLERMFEPGTTWDKLDPDGQIPGGMGLAIARDIVTRHNGVLWAQRGEQGGLLCTVRLPVDGHLT